MFLNTIAENKMKGNILRISIVVLLIIHSILSLPGQEVDPSLSIDEVPTDTRKQDQAISESAPSDMNAISEILATVSSVTIAGSEDDQREDLWTKELKADINCTGSLAFEYPLNLPDGTNDMKPTVSLMYNSFGKNGILGVGFLISGLSVIERDLSYPTKYNSDDRYLYKKQRLFYSNPSSSGDGNFHAERESYERISAYLGNAIKTNNPNTTSSYWVVFRKDGTKFYYGNTDDSRIDAVGKAGIPRLWALSRVEDSCGNYYTIEYIEDTIGGDFYPKRIVYTKNDTATINAYNVIDFSYEDTSRTDKYPLYLPTIVEEDRRLRWITVRVGASIDGSGGILLRKYRIDYEYGAGTGKSRITTIAEYGNDGNIPAWPYINSSYSPTGNLLAINLTWDSSQTSLIYGETTKYVDSSYGAYWNMTPMDANGDGKDDMIAYYIGSGTGIRLQVLFSNGAGAYSRGPYNQHPASLSGYGSNWHMAPADVNGDGLSDMIAYYYNGTSNLQMQSFISDGTGHFTTSGSPYSYPVGLGDEWYLSPTDINGDGRTDMVAYYIGTLGVCIKAFLSDGTGGFIPGNVDPSHTSISYSGWGMSSADVNGDGLSDMVAYSIGASGVSIQAFLSDGNGGYEEKPLTTPNTDARTSYWHMFAIDVNGDGCTDMVSYYLGPSGICIQNYLSNGLGGFIKGVNNTPVTASRSGSYWHMISADANGDGCTDLVSYYLGFNGMRIQAFISNRAGGYTKTYYYGPSDADFSAHWHIKAADQGGDGKADMISYYIGGGSGIRIRPFDYSFASDLVTQCTYQTGGSFSVEYTPSPQVTGAVVPTVFSYPSVVDNSSRLLVTNLEYSDGLGEDASGDKTITFSYNNVKRHSGLPWERKSLGFEKVIKTTTVATGDELHETYYRQDLPYEGLVSSTIAYSPSGAKVSETNNSYNKRIDAASPSGSAFIYLEGTRAKHYDGQATSYFDTKESYEYGTYGDVTMHTNYGEVDTSGSNVSLLDDQLTVTTYVAATGGRYVIKPLVETNKGYDDNITPVLGIIGETTYYYDTLASGSIDKGLVWKVERRINDTTVAAETLEYDLYGNVTNIKDPRFSAGAYAGYSTRSVYDPVYHCGVVESYDALSRETTIAYDTYRRPISITDPNSAITTHCYDAFGRQTSVTMPEDSVSNPTKITVYDDTSFPRSVHSKQLETGSAYLESWDYFDGLGRLVQTKSEAIGGWNTVDRYYDGAGRLCKVSAPYLTTASTYTARNTAIPSVVTEYDTLGRVVKTVNTDLSYRQTIYLGKATRAIDGNNHVTEMAMDKNQEIHRRFTGTYPNQALYSTAVITRSRGKVMLTDNAGNASVSLLDLLGRRTSYQSPDMGSWSFGYDVNGNLVSRIDPRGKTLGYSYDQLNRIIGKDYPLDADVAYTYDEATGHGTGPLGRLTSVTYARGSESYSYDKRGRITTLTRTLDGVSRSISTNYDSMDRPGTVTYPGSEVVDCVYGNDGNLSAITGYASNLSYEPNGKLKSISYANGVITTYDYFDSATEVDPKTNRTYSYQLRQILATKSGTSRQSSTYSYDAVGNVASKTDGVTSAYSETYTYDALDRLTGAVSTKSGSLAYTYNMIDTIATKEGKTYTYSTGRPHAVNSDGTLTYTYDTAGNMISRSDGVAIAYDDEGRVKTVSGTGAGSYSYGADFSRRIKEEGTKKTLYFFDEYEEEYTSGALSQILKYYSAMGLRIAQKTSTDGGATYTRQFLHSDHLGSSVLATSDAGAVVRTQVYKPYGSNANLTGTGQTKYQFTGKEKDGGGLYYFNARYYDPELGRFISCDPAIIMGMQLSLEETYNPYLYCGNNPINSTDPTGLVYNGCGSGDLKKTESSWWDGPYEKPDRDDKLAGRIGNGLEVAGATFSAVAGNLSNQASVRMSAGLTALSAQQQLTWAGQSSTYSNVGNSLFSAADDAGAAASATIRSSYAASAAASGIKAAGTVASIAGIALQAADVASVAREHGAFSIQTIARAARYTIVDIGSIVAAGAVTFGTAGTGSFASAVVGGGTGILLNYGLSALEGALVGY